MTKRMLIDTTHAEETRVVVLDGNRLEDYDVETAAKQQLKGNIYLAKIVRVEPSLQAAFVEFGGGRHGFLAFGEIHPDYYQIPVADRKRLLEAQEAEALESEEEEEREVARERNRGRRQDRRGERSAGGTQTEDDQAEAQDADGTDAATLDADAEQAEAGAASALIEAGYATQADPEAAETAMPRPDQVAQAAAVSQDFIVAPDEAHALFSDPASGPASDAEAAIALPHATETANTTNPTQDDTTHDETPRDDTSHGDEGHDDERPPAANDTAEAGNVGDEAGLDDSEMSEVLPPPEQVGGEHETDERPDRRTTPRFLRNYKIQEVMRRRQILLVQVVKEERGTKGAALTTYISLAGRFSVLMPNSPRGGGISRKITSAADRRRLKEITSELDLPRGMGLIVRTAGANRPKPEIIRDCEYLLDQWDQIRELTMKSVAPALIYEEASLIKRAIRDVYSRDVDDILVDGEAGWQAARDFMRMLMPTHARKVQLWKDPQPLFAKAQVEAQLDSMLQPNVQLRSGGYLVINQTEALVAIDVNSGRSTRERGIEETALRTNMEAAEEAARQLRLRDLAGLIVIDFIDMESRRNNAAVERKLKDALKNDRARIQVGSISHFGLLEMSRQRLRPSLAETNFVPCAHCNGTGQVRSVESAALHVLRGIEEEGTKRRAAEIVVHVAGSIALYVLNHKRVRLAEIESRYGLQVTFAADDTLIAPDVRIERVRARATTEQPLPVTPLAPPEPFEDPDEEQVAAEAETAGDDDAEAMVEAPEGAAPSDGEERPKRRRRRRRGGRREDGEATPGDNDAGEQSTTGDEDAPETAGESASGDVSDLATDDAATATLNAEPVPGTEGTDDGERKRRGRRGGRRRRRDVGADGVAIDATEEQATAEPETVAEPAPPRRGYSGPTPADPFGGANAFDFFDAVEEVEEVRVTSAPLPTVAAAETPVVTPAETSADMTALPVVTAPDPEAEQAFSAKPEPEAEPEERPGTPDPAESQTAADSTQAPLPAPVPEAPSEVTTAPDPVAEQTFDNAANSLPVSQPSPAGPTIGAPVAPIVIGAADGPPTEKRRGWWKR